MTEEFRSYLARRDPEGYYVITAKAEALKVLPPGVELVVAGEHVLIRTKSRSQALKILKLLAARNLLA